MGSDEQIMGQFCSDGIQTINIFMVLFTLFLVSLVFMNKDQRSFALEIVFGLIGFMIFMVVELCKALDDSN